MKKHEKKRSAHAADEVFEGGLAALDADLKRRLERGLGRVTGRVTETLKELRKRLEKVD